MTYRIAFILAGALGVAGCNAPGNQQALSGANVVAADGAEAILESWKGKRVDDLLTVWGAPKDSQKLPRGSTLLVYEQTKTIAGQDNSALMGGLLGGGSRAQSVGSLFNNSGQNLEFECVINVRVSKQGNIEQAVISRKKNPLFEDLCAKLARPPLRA